MGGGIATRRLGYLTENTHDIVIQRDQIRWLWNGQVGSKELKQVIRMNFNQRTYD